MLHAGAAFAAEPASRDAALARIESQRLAENPAWLALLDYRRNATGAWRSQADRGGFLLAATGQSDPHAELLANIDALFYGGAAQAQARCRFPARYLWLQRTLEFPAQPVLEACPELAAWYAPLEAQAVYIDFASAYLENPSSMFGHTFLRFAPQREPDAPALLTPTINYAADSNERDGILEFIVKGLSGGFPGVTDQLAYFRRLRMYADNEGRDLWEYRLQLNPEQIELLLLHIWEIKDSVFDYYFLDENCSYRTLALIAAAAPEQGLLDPFDGAVVPVETLKVLRRQGIAAEPVYRPSSVKTLYWHLRDFSAAETRQVRELAKGQTSIANLPPMPDSRRARLLGAAGEYAGLLINRNQLPLDRRDEVVQPLIRERLRVNQPLPPDPPPAPPPPEATHGGHALSAGWINDDGASGIELGYAGFAHELLDPLAGYEPGAEVAVLDGSYRYFPQGGSGLERFDLLRVASKTPATTLFTRRAWAMHLGAQRKDVLGQRPLVGSLGYASGRAYATPLGVLALTAGIDIDGAPALDHGYGVEGGFAADLTRQALRVNYQLFFERARYIWGEDSLRGAYGLRAAVPLQSNLSLRLEWRHGGSADTGDQTLLQLRMFY